MKRYWFAFCQSDLILEKVTDGIYTIPFSEDAPAFVKSSATVHTITPFSDGTEVRAVRIDQPITDDPQYEMCGLRASYYKLNINLYNKAGKCQEILYWDQNTRFCGVCGGPMKLHTDISKRCTVCGKEVWPHLATAVIVLVSRGDEVLLVHAKNFRGNFYGLIAGFVETGETLEEAVRREVKEETGLAIKHLRYFGSQPWPYPSALMVGFFAEYDSGDIRLQRSELAAGGWYKKDHLPQIPEKLSIARKLIDHWLDHFNTEK